MGVEFVLYVNVVGDYVVWMLGVMGELLLCWGLCGSEDFGGGY